MLNTIVMPTLQPTAKLRFSLLENEIECGLNVTSMLYFSFSIPFVKIGYETVGTKMPLESASVKQPFVGSTVCNVTL